MAAAATLIAAALPAPAVAPEAPVDYLKDVHPILAENCYSCHAGDTRKGGLSMSTRDLLLKGSEDGPVVVEGKVDESLLIKLVTSTDDDEVMPPKGRRLTPEEVATLRAWIDSGLAWDESAHAKQEYEAPLRLQATPPKTAAANLVDAYVTDYLQARSLDAGAVVDDARFVRRVYLDITGLLPTPDTLRAFEKDPSPDKRAALVDRLLADDQGYAEHWMTFWNDMLRNDYQGTGYIDGGRKQITDWLYESLYTNRRYDEFVRNLIAPQDPASEGFIKGIVWRGDNAVVQQQPMQAAINLSQVFLGLNLKCASCHDSFVNNWSLSHTFALANCFSDEPMELVRCETDLGVQAEYGFLWRELGEVDGALPKPERMQRIAAMTTSPENGYFARTIVNRVWALLMGRGLVEPLDSIDLEPWDPALLDGLAQDFVNSGYDLRNLIRTIATSQAYQWNSVPASEIASKDYVFRGPTVRHLSAEQYYDALASLTGVWQANPKFVLPQDKTPEEIARQEAIAKAAAGGKNEPLPDDANTVAGRKKQVRAWRVPVDPLMKALGRTAREQVTSRRETVGTTLQALELSNGQTLFQQIQLSAEALQARWDGTPEGLIISLYEHGLQRAPSVEEIQLAYSVVGDSLAREGLEDLLWSLAMLPEFQLIY
jgi:mono/diheme cytochrome c family protein